MKVDSILKLIEEGKTIDKEDKQEQLSQVRKIRGKIRNQRLTSEETKKVVDALKKSKLLGVKSLIEEQEGGIEGTKGDEGKISKIVSMSGENIEKLKEALPLLNKLEKEKSKPEKQKLRNTILKALSGYKGPSIMLPELITSENYTKGFKSKLPPKVGFNGFKIEDAIKEWNKKNVR